MTWQRTGGWNLLCFVSRSLSLHFFLGPRYSDIVTTGLICHKRQLRPAILFGTKIYRELTYFCIFRMVCCNWTFFPIKTIFLVAQTPKLQISELLWSICDYFLIYQFKHLFWVLKRTQKICFGWEMIFNYAFLSGGLDMQAIAFLYVHCILRHVFLRFYWTSSEYILIHI